MGRRAAGEGSIYKDTSSGLWVASVRVPNGKRLQRRSKTKSEAVANKAELLQQARLLSGRPDPNTTVGEAVERFVRHEAEKAVASASSTVRTQTYVDYITRAVGTIRLLDLTTSDVEAMLEALARRDQRPLGRDSLTRLRSLLQRSIDRSVARGDVDRNVARVAELPSLGDRVPGTKLVFDRATAIRFLESCDDHPYGDMWFTQVRLCLRPGEVGALTWGSFTEDLITVSRSVRRLRNGKAVLSDELKTEGARRTLNVPEDMRARLLMRWVTVMGCPEDALMFPAVGGGPIDPAGNRRSLRRHCERHELFVTGEGSTPRPPTPNELRHTGISLLADQGAPNELLAQLAGHTSTRMVDQVYRHRIRPSVDTVISFDWR